MLKQELKYIRVEGSKENVMRTVYILNIGQVNSFQEAFGRSLAAKDLKDTEIFLVNERSHPGAPIRRESTTWGSAVARQTECATIPAHQDIKAIFLALLHPEIQHPLHLDRKTHCKETSVRTVMFFRITQELLQPS
ncbi:unnamed protein product [Cyprideis torosa]|uniref:Uncharacterized protein n=1 Tax=Cyprideis torosa TaxID=163714 RepID=A0A7R8W1K7_9CRUS|nr:unnamed protein product [Cyprideis torosa]CAG0881008.1 unnamed protein product [Cyprideis torosa]